MTVLWVIAGWLALSVLAGAVYVLIVLHGKRKLERARKRLEDLADRRIGL